MLRYLAKRLAYAILVLFAVSLLTFFMSTVAPGDIVEAHLRLDGGQSAYQQKTYSQWTADYTRIAERLGLALPQFYFSIQPICFPDTLHRVLRNDERDALRQLLYLHGDWKQLETCRGQILDLIRDLEKHSSSQSAWSAQITNDLQFLLVTSGICGFSGGIKAQ